MPFHSLLLVFLPAVKSGYFEIELLERYTSGYPTTLNIFMALLVTLLLGGRKAPIHYAPLFFQPCTALATLLLAPLWL
jgi:hypothetical protein